MMTVRVKSEDGNGTGGHSTTEHVQQLLQLWRHYTKILPVDDITVKNIASDICSLLAKTNSLEALSVFLNELPTSTTYWKNENVLKARVQVALYHHETDKVKQILTVCLHDIVIFFLLLTSVVNPYNFEKNVFKCCLQFCLPC